MTSSGENSKIYNREFKELVNQIYAQEFSEENKVTKMITDAKLIPTFQYDLKTYKLTILFKETNDINSFKDLNKFYNIFISKRHTICIKYIFN